MPSPKKPREKKATGAVIPAWHPSFRDVEHLPDLKTVRTSFFINVGAVTIALFLLGAVGWREYTIAALGNDLAEANRVIDKDNATNSQLVALNDKFQKESMKIKELQEFTAGKFTFSDFLIRLAQTIPSNFGIDNIDYHGKGATNVVGDGSIVLSGSVKDDPKVAAGLVESYAGKWRKDPDFGALFESVESSELRKNPDTKRLNFNLVLKFKDTSPKPPPKPAEAPK